MILRAPEIILLMIPAAPLTLDEVMNDINWHVMQVLRIYRALIFSGKLWNTDKPEGFLGKNPKGWIGFERWDWVSAW